MQFSDCGNPYLVDNADIVKGPLTIGSLQRYQCRKGFVPSRSPHIMCEPNAEWSPPDFKCIGNVVTACLAELLLPHLHCKQNKLRFSEAFLIAAYLSQRMTTSTIRLCALL